MAKKAVPKTALHKDGHKNVRLTDQKQMPNPSWRFSCIDKDGPYRWPLDNPELLQKILAKLADFDSMRWAEIEGSDHHSIPRGSLSKDAQKRLEKIQQDDIDALMSFHFDGRRRIFGIKDLGTIKLLWWDEKHQVCESTLKHT